MTSWLLLIAVLPFGIAAMVGAPYLPVRRQDVATLLDMASLKPGQTVIDLGCGDGRLLRAAAKRGYRAIGYEINPLLWLAAIIWCWPWRRLITVKLRNFWSMPLPPCEALYVFLIPRYMPKLDQKLTAELTVPTVVVSYAFHIPGKSAFKTSKNAFAYRYPN